MRATAWQPIAADLTNYGPGRTRVVKLIVTSGTEQANCAGQPGSVLLLRQSRAVLALIS